MKWILLAALFPQDNPEKIFVRIPEFYFVNNVLNFNTPHVVEHVVVIAEPQDDKREYFIQKTDKLGRPLGDAERMSSEDFYYMAHCILRYGVRDSADVSFPKLNEGFRDFIKFLLDKKFLAPQQLPALAKHYHDSNWLESLYWLDEVEPGLMLAADNGPVHSNANTGNLIYFTVLLGIKQANGDLEQLTEVQKNLDTSVIEKDQAAGVSTSFFATFARSYAELSRKGLDIPEEIRPLILKQYLKSDPSLEAGIVATFQSLQLPLPSAKAVEGILKSLLDAIPKPRVSLVGEFRFFKLEFPKEHAKAYRDALLEERAVFEDIECLLPVIGEEDIPAETWKQYGDSVYQWHFSKDARIFHIDSGDYYHSAVEAYRRVSRMIGKLGDDPKSKERKYRLAIDPKHLKRLCDCCDDLSVRMRDLLFACELAQLNPKDDFVLNKLEKRIELYESKPMGAYHHDGRILSRHLNEHGQQRVPFREAVELADFLRDGVRIRELSRRIADWAYSQLEAGEPVYENLEAISDLYEELKFTEGARSLGLHLFDSGFVLPVRRLLQIGGIYQEASEKYYGKYSEEQLKKIQDDFNSRVRRK